MKPSALLINTARGNLLDYRALRDALEAGRIAGAALDVFGTEPYAFYRELSAMPNVTVTHHMAFYTDNCTKTVVEDSVKSCILFMEGKENPWQVY